MGTIVTTTTESKSQEAAIQGDVGTYIGPEAQVGAPGGGTVHAEPFSEVHQEISLTGYGAGDVVSLLDPIFEQSSEERQAFTGLTTSLIESSKQAQERQAGVIAATKAPETTQIQSLIPIMIIGLILFFLVGGR